MSSSREDRRAPTRSISTRRRSRIISGTTSGTRRTCKPSRSSPARLASSSRGARVVVPIRVVFHCDTDAALAYWRKFAAEGRADPKPTPPIVKLADQPGGTAFWGIRVESADVQVERFPPRGDTVTVTVATIGEGQAVTNTQQPPAVKYRVVDLSPSSPYEREIDLGRLYEFSKPGEYRVQTHLHLGRIPRPGQGRVGRQLHQPRLHGRDPGVVRSPPRTLGRHAELGPSSRSPGRGLRRHGARVARPLVVEDQLAERLGPVVFGFADLDSRRDGTRSSPGAREKSLRPGNGPRCRSRRGCGAGGWGEGLPGHTSPTRMPPPPPCPPRRRAGRSGGRALHADGDRFGRVAADGRLDRQPAVGAECRERRSRVGSRPRTSASSPSSVT